MGHLLATPFDAGAELPLSLAGAAPSLTGARAGLGLYQGEWLRCAHSPIFLALPSSLCAPVVLPGLAWCARPLGHVGVQLYREVASGVSDMMVSNVLLDQENIWFRQVQVARSDFGPCRSSLCGCPVCACREKKLCVRLVISLVLSIVWA